MDLQLILQLADERHAILIADGELDLAAVDLVHNTVAQLIADGRVTHLVMDLTPTRFLDAAGIGALVRSRNVAASAGVVMTIDGARDIVDDVLRITGAYDVLLPGRSTSATSLAGHTRMPAGR